MNALLVAGITTGGTIIVALLEWSRRQNQRDHGIVATALNRIEVKIDKHLDEHND